MDIEIDGDLSVHGNANGGSPSSSRHGSATGETRRIDQSEAGDGDEDGMDAEDGAPPKKKRRRPKNSCLPCQRRKTKCDKLEQCGACVKRNEGNSCAYDLPALVGPVPSDIVAEFGALKRRIINLERQVQSQRQGTREKEKVNDSREHAPPPAATPSVPLPLPLPSPTPPPAAVTFTPSIHARPPSSLIDVPLPPFPSRLLPSAPPDAVKIDAETEEAVQTLEDLALGRRQFFSLGRNTEVPCVGKTRVVEPQDVSDLPSPSVPVPGAYTTILRDSRSSGRSLFIGRARQDTSLLECLPEKSLSDVLVSEFFVEIGWVYNVIHRPTFEAEHEELWRCVANGTSSRIDPAWLAVYWMVLTWSISALNKARSREVLRYFPESEVKNLPEIWLDAADKALQASDWAGRPQVRTAQAIMLKLSYQRTSPVQGAASQDASSFFVWLSTATRICQLLGLHKLGSDPHTMPRDDPGWPRQACCLKRELAKRLWLFVVSFDWLYCSGRGIGQIFPQSFDTTVPLNVDDDDLGLQLDVKERPADYLTDISFCRAKYVIAKHQMTAKLVAEQSPMTEYKTVMALDEELQEEITALNLVNEGSNPRRKSYHRALLTSMVHNRALRLHRPFFMRGWREERYQPSCQKALRSAIAICHDLQGMVSEDINLEHLWFVTAYGLGAVMTLFLNILREEDEPTLRQGHVSSEKRNLLLGVRSFFVCGLSQGDASSGVRYMSLQAVRIVDHFLLPRTKGETTQRFPVASIFREIAATVNSPTHLDSNPAAPTSSQVDQSPTPWTIASPPYGNGLMTEVNTPELLNSSLFSHPVQPPLPGDNFFDFFSGYHPSGVVDAEESFGVAASREGMLSIREALPPSASLDDWQHLFNLGEQQIF